VRSLGFLQHRARVQARRDLIHGPRGWTSSARWRSKRLFLAFDARAPEGDPARHKATNGSPEENGTAFRRSAGPKWAKGA